MTGAAERPDVGCTAPAFALPTHFGEVLTAHECRQRADADYALIVFFPFAFSPVCRGEMEQLSALYPQLSAAGIEVIAISCDPKYALAQWAAERALPFVLCSDFWPHGQTARAFGTFDETRGCPVRASFLTDSAGRIVRVLHSMSGEARDFSALLG